MRRASTYAAGVWPTSRWKAGERALAHERVFGEYRDGELLVEVAGDPSLNLAQLRPCGLLC